VLVAYEEPRKQSVEDLRLTDLRLDARFCDPVEDRTRRDVLVESGSVEVDEPLQRCASVGTRRPDSYSA
jgi:hypothetical protein